MPRKVKLTNVKDDAWHCAFKARLLVAARVLEAQKALVKAHKNMDVIYNDYRDADGLYAFLSAQAQRD